MPRREPGSYLGPDRENNCWETGCKTCGWYVSDEYETVREQWLVHVHDPMIDIEERVAEWRISGHCADAVTMMIDIEYLLWLLDQTTDNHE